MGLYDRDYYRDENDNKRARGKRLSAVAAIIWINVILYIIDAATYHSLFDSMALVGTEADNPLQWYRCLTYAFAHDPNGFMHILCNMLVLFFFGPPLERLYGKTEFVLFYLSSALFGGIFWNIAHAGSPNAALGASGAVTAIVILFACNFPRAQLLLWGIIPLPAWLAGILFVLYDMYGSITKFDNVAHEIHFSGAVFALLYFFLKIRLTSVFRLTRAKGRPTSSASHSDSGKKSFFPFSNRKERAFDELDKEVDAILAKISRVGEENLTEKERETLRYASREYQKRKK